LAMRQHLIFFENTVEGRFRCQVRARAKITSHI
jgi:hypothetical protein